MESILQSAQFYHAKRGASLAELTIGRQGADTAPFAPDRTKGLLVMGGLLSAAVSLLGIYLLLSRTTATLYFALACVAMALREAIQSQAWIYFPISGNVSFMLEYLSVVLLTVFLTLYLGQYADNLLLKSTWLLALAGSGIYGLCVLLGDSRFYTSVLIFYQVPLLVCIVPSVAGLFFKMRNPSREQAAALYGTGTSVSVTAAADNGKPLSYQWYSNITGSTTAQAADSSGTISALIVTGDDYYPVSFTLTVIARDKIPVTVTGLTARNATCDGHPHTGYTGSASSGAYTEALVYTRARRHHLYRQRHPAHKRR